MVGCFCTNTQSLHFVYIPYNSNTIVIMAHIGYKLVSVYLNIMVEENGIKICIVKYHTYCIFH